jgi:hypothetical protein
MHLIFSNFLEIFYYILIIDDGTKIDKSMLVKLIENHRNHKDLVSNFKLSSEHVEVHGVRRQM